MKSSRSGSRDCPLYRIYLRKHVLPAIGSLRAEKVTRATIAKLHLKIGKKRPVTANRVKETIRGMFAFGIARALLPPDMRIRRKISRSSGRVRVSGF